MKLSGYIAMLAVDKRYRGNGIGKLLVQKSVDLMKEKGADEIVIETEVTNKASLGLYGCKPNSNHVALGFVREKRLINYYLNGNDAFKLILYLNS